MGQGQEREGRELRRGCPCLRAQDSPLQAKLHASVSPWCQAGAYGKAVGELHLRQYLLRVQHSNYVALKKKYSVDHRMLLGTLTSPPAS